MHYVGDIHQPLHATSRVDSKYPSGDRGGNDFPITSQDGAKNLHSVWDSVVFAFTSDISLVSPPRF
jgi:S1/P1 Nuclease